MKTADGSIERTGPSSWRVQTTSEHVCGLQGYDPMLGDSCPACDERYRLWDRREECRWPPVAEDAEA